MDDLKSVLGEALLRYLLADNRPDLDEPTLSAERADVVSAIRQIIARIPGQHPIERTVGLGNLLLLYDDDAKTTFANACRLQSGGALPHFEPSSDDVLDNLLLLGRDIYPGLLLPPLDDQIYPMEMSIGGGVFNHPQHTALCWAILADTQLSRLFPGASPDLDLSDMTTLTSIQSRITFSSGRSSGLQLVTLVDCLLLAAYYQALLEPSLSLEMYLEKLRTVLDDVRVLATRRNHAIPTIFGFTNVELPPDTRVDLATGQLRSAVGFNSKLLPSRLDLSAVLVTKAPLQLLDIEPYDPMASAGQHPFARFEPFAVQMAATAAETERIAELLRLAFLLASPPEGLFALRYACRTMLDPLQHQPTMQWRSDPPFATSPIASLGGEALERVKKWAQKAKHHPKRLDIAMRRTLSAAVERDDPHDGFIDAVLAWENMFSGRPETNLRVCGAIAWLLKPDSYQERTELFGELKDLYTKRSNLVHGAIERVDDVVARRDRAVRISVESMKRLYNDADLLRIKDSAERGGMILMGRQPSETAEAPDARPVDWQSASSSSLRCAD